MTSYSWHTEVLPSPQCAHNIRRVSQEPFNVCASSFTHIVSSNMAAGTCTGYCWNKHKIFSHCFTNRGNTPSVSAHKIWKLVGHLFWIILRDCVYGSTLTRLVPLSCLYYTIGNAHTGPCVAHSSNYCCHGEIMCFLYAPHLSPLTIWKTLGPLCKVTQFCPILNKFGLARHIFMKVPCIKISWKPRTLAAALLHADRRKDMNKLIWASGDYANAPKN